MVAVARQLEGDFDAAENDGELHLGSVYQFPGSSSYYMYMGTGGSSIGFVFDKYDADGYFVAQTVAVGVINPSRNVCLPIGFLKEEKRPSERHLSVVRENIMYRISRFGF